MCLLQREAPAHVSMSCFATQEQKAQIFQKKAIVIAREHGKSELQIRLQLFKNLSRSPNLMLFFIN